MGIKILLVDDSSTIRRMQKTTLAKIGYSDIDESEDGKDALEKMAANNYGLVLLDLNMPVMDGLECLKKIKGNDSLKDVPVIIVTSESDKSKIIEAITAGASNYLVKPFLPDSLQDKIISVLGSP